MGKGVSMGLFPKAMTAEEYQQHEEENDGVCMWCGEWTEGGVEGDAAGYECTNCERFAVMGTQEALLMGLLAVDGE
jgi:hypothetical protein